MFTYELSAISRKPPITKLYLLTLTDNDELLAITAKLAAVAFSYYRLVEPQC